MPKPYTPLPDTRDIHESLSLIFIPAASRNSLFLRGKVHFIDSVGSLHENFDNMKFEQHLEGFLVTRMSLEKSICASTPPSMIHQWNTSSRNACRCWRLIGKSRSSDTCDVFWHVRQPPCYLFDCKRSGTEAGCGAVELHVLDRLEYLAHRFLCSD